jgi:hypothetical protein
MLDCPYRRAALSTVIYLAYQLYQMIYEISVTGTLLSRDRRGRHRATSLGGKKARASTDEGDHKTP